MKPKTILILLLISILALPGLALGQAKKPNILVIMGDDIGWFNPSCYNRGMMHFQTPNIDRIAAEGAMFNTWYAQQSCTAGRAAFITGQSPIRTGLTKVGIPGADVGLRAEDPTIAELLKVQGYALPCIFPKRAEDLPFFDKDAKKITYDLWHGYCKLEPDGNKPAFPFGFGLSYTTFSLGNLRLAHDRIAPDGSVVVTAEVANTGKVAGEEVVQLYIGARSSKVERAPKGLKAFTKVALAPGEKRTVRLAVPARNFAYYDAAKGWIVEPGTYEAILGRHSLNDASLRARFTVD